MISASDGDEEQREEHPGRDGCPVHPVRPRSSGRGALPRAIGLSVRGSEIEDLLERLELLDALAGPQRDGVQRPVGEVDRHAGLVAEPLVEPLSSAPPPVITIPRSMMSPESSGGHLSRWS